MGRLAPEQQRRLIDLLAKLPGIEQAETRNALLLGVPLPLRHSIPQASVPRIALDGLVQTIESDAARGADQNWPIEIVIQNAINLVRGSALAAQFEALLAEPRASDASEVAGGSVARLPNIPALRGFIAAALSTSELKTLCFDYFRPVYDELDDVPGKSEKITMLVNYCERHGKLLRLVELVRQINPYQYQQFARELWAS
jgi:hypothetical protein